MLEDFAGAAHLGSFYEFEIQMAANDDIYLIETVLQRKGNEFKVRWLGLDKTHDSWTDVKNKL